MILMPLPRTGFDPTESAIPWKILKNAGFEVKFATPDGNPAKADEITLSGKRLGIWSKILRARQDSLEAYLEMEQDPNYQNPISYDKIESDNFEALIVPGGHAPGMREMLDSEKLKTEVSNFFVSLKPVAAICHGVLLVARSNRRGSEKSVLFDYRTTGLLKFQEKASFWMTRLWLGNHYRTYAKSVQEEVGQRLIQHENFIKGPRPVAKDTPENMKVGFALADRKYVSARWPGDAYNFGEKFVEVIRMDQEYREQAKARASAKAKAKAPAKKKTAKKVAKKKTARKKVSA